MTDLNGVTVGILDDISWSPHVLLEEVFMGPDQVLRGHRAVAAAGNTRLGASTLFE